MVKNAEMLAEAGIRLLAVDFDLTLVNIHTGGGWRQNAEQLARRVRPGMKKLIQTSMANGVHVAIVTFSPQVCVQGVNRLFETCAQVKLISEVLALTFPSLSPKVPSLLLVLSLLGRRYREQIVVRGLDDSWPYHGDGTGEGKQVNFEYFASPSYSSSSSFRAAAHGFGG